MPGIDPGGAGIACPLGGMPVTGLGALRRLPAWLAHAWGVPEPEGGPAPALPAGLVEGLGRAGLGLPAYLFLQFQRPMLFVYGQFLRAGGALFPGTARLAALLEDPDRLHALFERLLAPGDRP